MTVIVNTSLEQLPRLFRKFASQVPFATSRALTATAFDVRGALQSNILPNDLTLRNVHTQRGIRVRKADRANTKFEPTAEVGSIDYYMERQVQGSYERTSRGVRLTRDGKIAGSNGGTGQRYMLVPGPKRRTKSGKLRRPPKNLGTPFAVKKSNGSILLMALRQTKRKTRRENRVFVFGLLTPIRRYRTRVDWEDDVNAVILRRWPVQFRKAMIRAARTAK